MIERVSSGIKEVDDTLQGGYPQGAVISFYGSQDYLRKHLYFAFLQQDSSEVLFINTRDTIDQIRLEGGLHQASMEGIVFLDGVNWRNRRFNSNSTSQSTYEVNNLTDLNAILAKIMDICDKETISSIIFDSPSSLLLYSTPGKEQVFKFFELLTAFTRSRKITLCYTLDPSIHAPEIIATMHYLSDGAIQLGTERNGSNHTNYFMVSQMAFTQFTQQKINLQ